MSGAAEIKQTGVAIKLDKERHLIFDFNSFCEIEDKFGSVQELFENMEKTKMHKLRYLLYLGLKNEDESLTEEKAGSLAKPNQFGEVEAKIIIAMGYGLPEKEKNVQSKGTTVK